MSRVLLLAPVFHGYGSAIAHALDRRGHITTLLPYDAHDGWRAKARHQLVAELPAAIGVDRSAAIRGEVTAGALDALAEHRPDVVVVVKGDVLDEAFWEELDRRRTPRVVWLYDELRRTAYPSGLLAAVGPVASYSLLDVAALTEQGVPARHLPLAFDRDLEIEGSGVRRDEISFVGARYPSRERTLLALRSAGLPVRAYGRDWSGHVVDRLRTWHWRRPDVPAERDLDRSGAYEVMADAAATLNMHADQDGFTMRTFEACGVGGVQLIDRKDVAELYDDGVELASWTSTDELVDLCERARVDLSWSTGLRERGCARTLAEHTFDHRVAVLEELWC
jgi:spore maturation protein CgeB